MRTTTARALLIITAAFCHTGYTASGFMTVDDALGIALESNYGVRIAANDAEIAKINNTTGNAGMLPLASLNASDNIAVNEPPAGGAKPDSFRRTSNIFNVSARLDWTLFDGGRMFVAKERLARIEALGALQYKNEVMRTAADVITAYYGIVRQKQQLVFVNEVISLNRERVTIAQTAFTAGLQPKTVQLQAVIDLNVYREKAVEQEAVIRSLKRSLNNLLCRDAAVDFDVADSIPLSPAPARDKLLDRLDSSNVSLRQLQEQIEIAALSLRESRALFSPKLSVSAGYAASGNSTAADPAAGTIGYGPQAGASITVPLFQAGNAMRQVTVSRKTLESARLNLQQNRQQIRAHLESVLDDFESQKRILDIERENVLLAKENLDISMQRLRLGQTTMIELRLAEESYADSRTRQLSIEYNLKVAETTIRLLMAEQ